ncbi:MAG: hypothetical protein COA57_11575, partial [Flavobacteriales bacterium]
NKIDFYESFDKSKVLIMYRRVPDQKRDKKNHDKIGLMVYDNNLEPIWNREVKMPYTEAEMDNLGYTVDSKGNVYILALVKTNEEPYLELLKYSPDIDNPIKIKVGGEGKSFSHGIQLQEGKNGQIYCAGFYGRKKHSDGVYVSVLDTRGNVKNEKFHEIPIEIINQYIKEGKQEKNEKKEEKGKEVGVYELGLDQILIDGNGGLTLIGEVFYTKTRTSYGSGGVGGMGGAKTSIEYFYKEMFLTKISPEGELEWMKKLIKNQYKREGGTFGMSPVFARIRANYFSKIQISKDLSYKYLRTETDHYLLFLDNIKNLNLPENKKPAKHLSGAGGYLTAYKVNDETGAVSKASLFDTRNVNGMPVYQFEINRISKTKDDEIIVEFYKKKKQDIFLRVNINR